MLARQFFFPQSIFFNVFTYSCVICVGISFVYKALFCFLFNLYVPCFSAYEDSCGLEVLECMSFIDKTINDFIDCNGVSFIIIIAGDYNAKFYDI